MTNTDLARHPRLQLGCLEVSAPDAMEILRVYTAPPGSRWTARARDFYSWPYYDGLSTGSQQNELNDGDLLASVLLNVNPKIHGFATLQALRPQLEAGLSEIPSDRDLADASDAEIELVAQLFAPLGRTGLLGVKGTVLAKVLHRKRPRLIPLYDTFVSDAYNGSRIEPNPTRSWSEYVAELMTEMRKDLREPADTWQAIRDRCAYLPGVGSMQLTSLRILDILVWSLGKKSSTL